MQRKEKNSRRRKSSWRKLDSSGLLFSAVSTEHDPRVFRFYCELKEEVDPESLQVALDKTLQIYPIFLSVMRRGLFWNYLESSDLQARVKEEYKPPCAPLYIRDKQSLLFEVTYFKTRINFEVFHALTDGTGAMEFLKELVRQYLVAHGDVTAAVHEERAEITIQDQEKDGFLKYYTQEEIGVKKQKTKAFQLKKMVNSVGELRISERMVSVKALLAKARALDVSMTVLITAVYLCAIHQEMTKQQEKRPIILMVPVNLRNFFPLMSMLNFFGWIEPCFWFGRDGDDFETVLRATKTYFEEQLTKEKVAAQMNGLKSLEKHPILRFLPLEVKHLGISAGSKQAAREVTAIFSNMGIVKLPAQCEPYIQNFGVYTSTPKMELTTCSFGDTLMLSFTSRFDTVNIQRNFFQILENLEVESEQRELQYPKNDTPKLTGIKVFKIFSFLCAVAMVISVAVNVMFTPQSFWSLVAVGGIASLWVALSMGYYKRHNLLKDTMWLLVLVTCGSMLWDVLTGWKGWSVNYVFPAMGIVAIAAMVVITKIQSHIAREYMIYLLMAAVYSSVIPFILLLVGAVHFVYLSVISTAIGILVVIGLMLFRWREFKEEMAKKFHV